MRGRITTRGCLSRSDVPDPDYDGEDSWDEGPSAKKQMKPGSGRPRKYKNEEERKAAKNVRNREMTRAKPRPAYGKHNSPCPLYDLVLPSRQERFFHVENVHYPGQDESVKGQLHIYSRVCGKPSFTPSDLTESCLQKRPHCLVSRRNTFRVLFALYATSVLNREEDKGQ